MADSKRTLLDYLRIKNPDLDRTGCRSGGTTQGQYVYSTPYKTQAWTDFEFETLIEMYGGTFRRMLESRHDLQDRSNIAAIPNRQIYDEASLESLLHIWNKQVVSDALAAAQEEGPSNLAQNPIYMAKGGQARSPEVPVSKGGTTRKLRPDWAGKKEPAGCVDLPPNILPGDTKLSSKWHSSNMRFGIVRDMDNKMKWLPAIRQIYTYCIKANARYGFLITDQELLVIRISWMQKSDRNDSKSSKGGAVTAQEKLGLLECKDIPWEQIGIGASGSIPPMTMNLALWCLYMLAAVDHVPKYYVRDASPTPAQSGKKRMRTDTEPATETSQARRPRRSSRLRGKHLCEDLME
ncbi:MAG: hypothetical protein Q9171_004629 [Xanthocarpia ochracea]